MAIFNEENFTFIDNIELEYSIFDESYGGVAISSKDDYPRFKRINKCKVRVCWNEGSNIPHFHITGENIDCCIQIYDNRYFEHGNHTGTLKSNSNCQVLNLWLNGKYKNNTNINRWNAISNLWIQLNGIPDNIEMFQPNYDEIKPYKG